MTRTIGRSFCIPEDADERDAVRVRTAAGDCVASYSYPAVAVEGRGGVSFSGGIAENDEKL